jgi:cell volume regulation protein A
MATYYLLIAATLLLMGIFSSKLSEKFGIPALILFLGIGMLAGSDGPGGIYFNNAGMAKLFGTIALVYILFSGAMETDWVSVRPVLARGILLSSVGVFITAIAVGLFARVILHFSLKEGMLLGAIVSSTDAAAVFTVLRSRNIGLKGNLKQLLEFESGSNDPMAVFLTVTLIQFMGADLKANQMVLSFVISMSCGAVLGLGIGKISSLVFNRIHLDYEGLYPVLSITIVMMVYSLTEILRGNGFLAVYIFGIVLGNSDFPYKRSLTRFHNGLAWLAQIAMFIVLGLLVIPSQLVGIIGPGLMISVFLMLIARPIAVFICLFRSSFTFNEKILASWAGLRGAVPIILATFPLMVGYPGSNKIFNIVFFIVLTSVLLQGKLLLPLAQWLKVYYPIKHRPRYPLEFDKTEDIDTQSREYDILPESSVVGKDISEIGLPRETLILLIRREKRFIVPKGNTKLHAHDTLLILAKQEDLHKTRSILRGI